MLEDVDLSGARGVLVNITGGLDMSIGEFDDVGNIIKEFASADATVVVGTVIDPEMTDEIRVTVVATGLGGVKLAKSEAPIAAAPQIEIVKKSMDINYDEPTVIRNSKPGQKKEFENGDVNMDYLDIPAFLRRQAD